MSLVLKMMNVGGASSQYGKDYDKYIWGDDGLWQYSKVLLVEPSQADISAVEQFQFPTLQAVSDYPPIKDNYISRPLSDVSKNWFKTVFSGQTGSSDQKQLQLFAKTAVLILAGKNIQRIDPSRLSSLPIFDSNSQVDIPALHSNLISLSSYLRMGWLHHQGEAIDSTDLDFVYVPSYFSQSSPAKSVLGVTGAGMGDSAAASSPYENSYGYNEKAIYDDVRDYGSEVVDERIKKTLLRIRSLQSNLDAASSPVENVKAESLKQVSEELRHVDDPGVAAILKDGACQEVLNKIITDAETYSKAIEWASLKTQILFKKKWINLPEPATPDDFELIAVACLKVNVEMRRLPKGSDAKVDIGVLTVNTLSPVVAAQPVSLARAVVDDAQYTLDKLIEPDLLSRLYEYRVFKKVSSGTNEVRYRLPEIIRGLECLLHVAEVVADKHFSNGQWNLFTTTERSSIARSSTLKFGLGRIITVESHPVELVPRTLSSIRNLYKGDTTTQERSLIDELEFESYEESMLESTDSSEKSKTEKTSLEKEISKVSSSSLDASAGINVSGKYGVTKVSASASAAISRSESETENSSISKAEEIIEKSIKAVTERRTTSTRSLRKVTDSFRHLTQTTSSDDKAIVEAEVWEKRRFRLLDGGARLMVQLNIPEPGIRYLEKFLKSGADELPPEEFDPETFNGGKPILPEAFSTLVKMYPKARIPEPPPLYADVKHSDVVASRADNETDVNGHMAGSSTLEISDGYAPVELFVSAHSMFSRGDTYKDWAGLSVSLAGMEVIKDVGFYGYFSDKYNLLNAEYKGAFSANNSNEQTDVVNVRRDQGVALTYRMVSLKSNMGTININLRCIRTKSTITRWRNEVIQSINKYIEEEKYEYDRRMARQESNSAQNLTINRAGRTTREMVTAELRKWCTQAITGEALSYDLLRQVTHQTVIGEQNFVEPVYDNAGHSRLLSEFDPIFEWSEMTYLYEGVGDRSLERIKERVKIVEPELRGFILAGNAKVYLPVARGMEKKAMGLLSLIRDRNDWQDIFSILDALQDDDKLKNNHIPYFDVLSEVLRAHKRGYETPGCLLKVENGKKEVSLVYKNDSTLDRELRWMPTSLDIGRKIEIEGVDYEIDKIVTETRLELKKAYNGETNSNATIRLAKKQIGEDFFKELPTGETIMINDAALDALEKLSNRMRSTAR